jgi:hypothetical protein
MMLIMIIDTAVPESSDALQPTNHTVCFFIAYFVFLIVFVRCNVLLKKGESALLFVIVIII